MKAMKRDDQITIRIPSKLRARLQKLADIDQRSLASYLVIALHNHADAAEKATR